jgi:ribonuclease J
VKPKFFMPIHGEYKHLKAHEKIAESLKIKPSHILIAGNGDILELTRRSFEKTGAIALSMIFVDGVEMGDLESAVIKERQSMSAGGILFVTLVVSEGMLLNPPDLTTRGFVGHANDKILEVIARDIEEQAHKLLEDGASKREIISHMKKHLKGLVYRLTRRNPLVEVQMIEV